MTDSISTEAAEAIGEMEDYTDLEHPDVPAPVTPFGKEGQAAMVRVIGERMKQARELCNLSQSAAAKRLGYANPSKLSKVEAASDTNSVPLWLICRAAEVYEVSTDFLFGFTDDWEVGARMTQEREVSAWLEKAWNVARASNLTALRALNDHLFELRTSVAATHACIREAGLALDKFAELNPEFAEDMRGSNRLATAVTRCLVASERAEAKLRKLQADRPVEIS